MFFILAHFLVFPSSRPAILFLQMPVLVIFFRVMRVGLVSIGHRELEGYTAVGRQWKPRMSSFSSLVGLLFVAAV